MDAYSHEDAAVERICLDRARSAVAVVLGPVRVDTVRDLETGRTRGYTFTAEPPLPRAKRRKRRGQAVA
jgi:hypothetical protein